MPNPWEIDWSQPQAPSGGLEAVPLPGKPKTPAAQTPTQAAIDAANLALKQRELAKSPNSANLTAEDRGKFTRQRQGALGLQKRIQEVEQLYTDSFRGSGGDVVNPVTGERTQTMPGLGSAAEYLPGNTPIIGRPVNEVFRTAGGALMGDLAAAYGLTAQQQNTPVELEIRFGPFIPKPGDNDQVIEAKIKRLKEIASEQERQALDALGIVQEDNEAPAQTGDRMTTAPGLIIDPGAGTIQSATTTKTVTDEELAAIAPNIGLMVSRGLPAPNIRMFMKKNGVDPAVLANLDEILRQRRDPNSVVSKWIKANPGKPYPIDPQYDVPLTGGEELQQNLGGGMAGAGVRNFADAATAGNLANIAGLLGGDEAEARQERSLSLNQAENPYSSLAGTIGGGVASTLAGEAALARLGLVPGAGRALLADTGYGATAGASNAGEGENWLAKGAQGALAALVGSGVGQGVTKGVSNVARGISAKPVRDVMAEEIPLTIGQAAGQSGLVGRTVKGLEDRASGFSGVGDQINARRLEGLQAMNAKTFDKALEPIGGNVGGKFGEEAVAEAQDVVGQAFTTALAGKAAQVDRPFITQAASAKNAIKQLPRIAGEVESSVDEVIASYFDPDTLAITGENMQALLRDLGQIKRSYAGDPLGHRVGKAIDQVEASIEGLFQRQAPDVMPQYNAAKKAFRRLSIVEDAVLRGKQTGGVFTPAQLGMADRANAVKYSGKHAAAAGKGEFHDFQRAMQEVLPSKVPDSGTAGRLAPLIVPGLVAGSGAGVGLAAGDAQSGAVGGLTLAGLLAAAYSRTGQRALVGSVARRGAKSIAAGGKIRKAAPLIGHGAATQAALGVSRD